MGFADSYLRKQKGFCPAFTDLPSERLRFAVVIPAHCEPDLTTSLDSLWNCRRPHGHVEVIIVVNSSGDAQQAVINANMATLSAVTGWIREHNDPAMKFLLMDRTKMPARDAGVGLARKTGMDEALFRFNQTGNPHGFILSFDADSRCDENYFAAIEEAVSGNTAINGFDIYFEHPVSGTEFPERVYQGITDYELHLRCINQFLRFTGFPFAYHTIGSCFGVRADVYASQGGMNKRKAGEDFYFLHKIIPLGHFAEINRTRVIPSPRASDRVPFGTGAAIGRYLSSEYGGMLTYSPESYPVLRLFFNQAGQLFRANPTDIVALIQKLPPPMPDYLRDQHAAEAVGEINANCRSASSFLNRFFRWFDAFRIVKFLNYANSTVFSKVPVREAALRYLEITGYPLRDEPLSTVDLLGIFRKIEKGEV